MQTEEPLDVRKTMLDSIKQVATLYACEVDPDADIDALCAMALRKAQVKLNGWGDGVEGFIDSMLESGIQKHVASSLLESAHWRGVIQQRVEALVQQATAPLGMSQAVREAVDKLVIGVAGSSRLAEQVAIDEVRCYRLFQAGYPVAEIAKRVGKSKASVDKAVSLATQRVAAMRESLDAYTKALPKRRRAES